MIKLPKILEAMFNESVGADLSKCEIICEDLSEKYHYIDYTILIPVLMKVDNNFFETRARVNYFWDTVTNEPCKYEDDNSIRAYYSIDRVHSCSTKPVKPRTIKIAYNRYRDCVK